MSQYVLIDDEDNEGEDEIMQALAILSSNEHRNTTHWRLVQEHHFKNGRLDETHVFVKSFYPTPDGQFEPVKMLVAEAEAISRWYIMAKVESQVRQSSEGDDGARFD